MGLRGAILVLASAAAEATVPNVWGGHAAAITVGPVGGCSGHLFGFSGLDGPTDETHHFVGVFRPDAFSLAFCGLGLRRDLAVRLGSDNATRSEGGDEAMVVHVATGDVLVAQAGGAAGNLTMAWASASLLAGRLPDAPGASVSLSGAEPWPGDPGACDYSFSAGDNSTVALCRDGDGGGAWGLAFSAVSSEDAVTTARAASTKGFDLDAVVAARLAPFVGVASLASVSGGSGVASSYGLLLAKAFSVMRVNALAPEGFLTSHWSTPDREPHKWMWLWDSAFHAMGMGVVPAAALDPSALSPGPDLAWEYVSLSWGVHTHTPTRMHTYKA